MADAEAQQQNLSTGKIIANAINLFWRGLFTIIWPLCLLPIVLLNNVPAFRCLYCVCVMAGYWITECLPISATALIPLVFFPTMGILDSNKTSMCYMKETNIMFFGGLVIAIAIEHCNLHRRIALTVIGIVGCSPKRLNLGLSACTMFVSMWISNTAATAMMLPIVEAMLMELQEQKIVKMYEEEGAVPSDPDFDVTNYTPTRNTICNYLTIAYSASIGGTGTLVGTGTNLTFKGIYETRFPENEEGLSFTDYMIMGAPIMLLIEFFNFFWLQFLYLGLLRPKSKDAKAITVGKEGEKAAYDVIKNKKSELGSMSFHETLVAIFFLLAVLLWFFRKPQFIPGWAEMLTKTTIKDGCPAIFVCLLLFSFPAKPVFLYAFSRNPEKRPTKASSPLLTWKFMQTKMHWGLVLLLGGGFALAEGSQSSGMSKMIGDELSQLAVLPRFSVMCLVVGFTTFLTQIFSSNVAVANILLPVIAEMSVSAKWHPMYLMMATTLSCSFAFCLPIATPPNALVAAPCNMPTKQMIIAGSGTAIIAALVTIGIFPFVSMPFNMDKFPAWAVRKNVTTAKPSARWLYF